MTNRGMACSINCCPFCGSTDLYETDHRILCAGCGATGPGAITRNEAIVAWNEPTDISDQKDKLIRDLTNENETLRNHLETAARDNKLWRDQLGSLIYYQGVI